jgi:hypothetical protein
MAKSEGSTDESVGRPKPWREGRYQRGGRSVDETVQTPPGTSPNPDTPPSTPVTKKDYDPTWKPSNDRDSEPPGGDAG